MDLLQIAVVGAIAGIAVPFVLRRMAGDAGAPAVTASSAELRYGTAMRVLGLFGLPLGALMFSAPFFAKSAGLALLFCIPIGLIFICFLAEVFVVKHDVDDDAIVCRSIFHRPYRIGWEDVRSVEYNGAMAWYVLRARDGRIGRVSPYMKGMRTFAEIVTKEVDRSAFTELSWKFLTRIANGASPILPSGGRSA